MIAVLVTVLNAAIASPCLDLAQRPAWHRIHYWDVTEGHVDDVDALASASRLAAIEQLSEIMLSPDLSREALTELRVRLAETFAAEGRYQTRCNPESGVAAVWWEKALSLSTLILSSDAKESRRRALRTHVDVLCGLARWDECLTAVDVLATDAPELLAACEQDIWIGNAKLSDGDFSASMSSFMKAGQVGSERGCAYALYGLASAQVQTGDLGGAIQSLSRLAETEVLRTSGPRGSTALEASVLDLGYLQNAEPGLGAADELAQLAPRIVRALSMPISEHPHARGNPLVAEQIVESLLAMGLLEDAFEQIESFEHDHGRDSRWLRWRIRRHRALTWTDEILERMLVRFVEHAGATVGGSGLALAESSTRPLLCRAAAMYSDRFSEGSQAMQMRRLLEDDCARH